MEVGTLEIIELKQILLNDSKATHKSIVLLLPLLPFVPQTGMDVGSYPNLLRTPPNKRPLNGDLNRIAIQELKTVCKANLRGCTSEVIQENNLLAIIAIKPKATRQRLTKKLRVALVGSKNLAGLAYSSATETENDLDSVRSHCGCLQTEQSVVVAGVLGEDCMEILNQIPGSLASSNCLVEASKVRACALTLRAFTNLPRACFAALRLGTIDSVLGRLAFGSLDPDGTLEEGTEVRSNLLRLTEMDVSLVVRGTSSSFFQLEYGVGNVKGFENPLELFSILDGVVIRENDRARSEASSIGC